MGNSELWVFTETLKDPVLPTLIHLSDGTLITRAKGEAHLMEWLGLLSSENIPLYYHTCLMQGSMVAYTETGFETIKAKKKLGPYHTFSCLGARVTLPHLLPGRR